MPRGIHRDAEQLHDILKKGVMLGADRVDGSIDLNDPSPVYIGVMFDVSGYGPHVGALAVTQGYGSVDESLQAADEMLEEWLLKYHEDDGYIDELQREWGDEWMTILTENFNGFAFELSPREFARAIQGTDTEKFIDVEPAEGLEEARRGPRAYAGRPRHDEGNLPGWSGASHVYSYLYGVLERLGAENWRREVERARKQRRKPGEHFGRPQAPAPTEEMVTIIEALDRGDEEELKALQMQYKSARFSGARRHGHSTLRRR